jgi:hypothetical protein
MPTHTRAGVVAVTIAVAGLPVLQAQTPLLVDVLVRHGIDVPDRSIERAFDEGVAPPVAVTPGAFATPLAMLAGSERERIDAAYTFGILAGRSGRAASDAELNAAGQALVAMIASDDRRTRIAGARVAGRVFAVPFESSLGAPALPAGLADALFVLLNRTNETDQLVAMDAFGLVRHTNAVSSLTERFHYYREGRKRALAGGALEALARIGDPSSVALVKPLVGDPWATGTDATALVVAFARERLLRDGSVAIIRQALDDRSRRYQARGYLAELGVAAP